MNRKVRWVVLWGGLLIGPFVLISFVRSADPPPSMEQLEEMIVTAKTKKDHEALAAYYEAEAKALELKAEQHQKLAKGYEESGGYEKIKGAMLQHCNAMIRKFGEAADEYLALAKMHHQMAEELPK